MSDRLAGARLKLERAEAHRQLLNAEFQAFWSSDAHEVVIEKDPQNSEVVLRAKINTSPDANWSVIVGEWAHDLRSALDYIAWELAEIHSGPAPNPVPKGKPGRPWRNTQFPIFIDANDYKALAPGYLSLIDPAHWAAFDAEQPYHTGNAWHSLALLSDLSNIDKHRTIHLLTSHVWAPNNLLASLDLTDCLVSEVKGTASGPVQDGAELARLSVRITGPNPQLQVNAQFLFGVTFEEPAFTWHPTIEVLMVMTRLGSDVRAVVDRFATLI